MEVKTDAIYSIDLEPLEGNFYRYVRTKFADQPLSMVGALENGGRYNIAGLFGALYLGFDRQTCEAEVSQGIAAGVTFKKGAFVVWEYKGDLQSIVRLDSAEILQELGVTEHDITIKGDHWTASGIGEHLHKRGDVEGLVAPSAHLQGGKCLDVYLDRVTTSSHVIPKSKLAKWP